MSDKSPLNISRMQFLALEGDDVSLQVLELLKVVSAIRTISTPDIGEISKMIESINRLTIALNNSAQNIQDMLKTTSNKSFESNATASFGTIEKQLELIVNMIKGTYGDAKKKDISGAPKSGEVKKESPTKEENKSGGEGIGLGLLMFAIFVSNIIGAGLVLAAIKLGIF